MVTAMKRRNRTKSFCLSAIHAMTTVTEEVMRTAVLKVPIGMFRRPWGQARATSGQNPDGAWTRSRM